MSLTLVEFLDARLAEDAEKWRLLAASGNSNAGGPRPERAAGLLREVHALRRKVAADQGFNGSGDVFRRELATIYSGHPDYRQEWRPVGAVPAAVERLTPRE